MYQQELISVYCVYRYDSSTLPSDACSLPSLNRKGCHFDWKILVTSCTVSCQSDEERNRGIWYLCLTFFICKYWNENISHPSASSCMIFCMRSFYKLPQNYLLVLLVYSYTNLCSVINTLLEAYSTSKTGFCFFTLKTESMSPPDELMKHEMAHSNFIAVLHKVLPTIADTKFVAH